MTPAPTIFLPGILMPVALRYAPLLAELGDAVRPVLKDLEVYATDSVPPAGFSLETEIAGLGRAADAAGLERFHIYAHSGGGAVALAYTALHGERVLSLALDEPACDFSPESLAEMRSIFLPMLDMPTEDMTRAFVGRQLRGGVAPASPAAPPPPWMSNRPAGIRAFIAAFAESSIPIERLADFTGPVYYSYGDLSHESWATMCQRLQRRFSHFASEVYVGASHMKTSHLTDPARVAAALRTLWASSQS